MSPTPSRGTTSGRAYNDLRNLARRKDRDVAEYFALYALEGFLLRLSVSRFSDQLILKGGLLMAAFSARRPTRDIDLSASGFPNEISEAEGRVRSIAEIAVDDGIEFDQGSVYGETIRDEGDYQGVRVHLTASLAKARIPFHVDINFGDPIWPVPVRTRLPRLLGGHVEILGYPLSMSLAEKVVTAIERGTASTRWRDFVDISSLSSTESVSGNELARSIEVVANYRRVELVPLADVLRGMAATAQQRWTAWRRKQHLEGSTPEEFQELLNSCISFVDPVLTNRALRLKWDPESRAWRLD